jgi:hypothetical protein
MTLIVQNQTLLWPKAKYNNVDVGIHNVGLRTFSEETFNHNLRALGHGDVGGPWIMERTALDVQYGHFQGSNPNLGYNGPTLPWHNTATTAYSIGTAPTDASYWPDGAKAIANTEPTNPIFDMSTFLGETVTAGLPAMVGRQAWKAQTLRAKHAGSEYLNYQFGWLPLVSDIRDFAYAVKHSSEIVENYKSHASLRIRRNLELFHDEKTSASSGNYFIDTANGSSIGSALTHTTASYKERKWFSGCYRYYLPMDDSMASRFRRYKAYAHKLLGVDLSPEVLWNIAPWSWAVDWFTDVGDVIHNVSAIGHNGLVLEYGYVMHSKSSVLVHDAGKWGRRTLAQQRYRRVAANPYGFGVTSATLNKTQVAVLAALGLTRGDARRLR